MKRWLCLLCALLLLFAAPVSLAETADAQAEQPKAVRLAWRTAADSEALAGFLTDLFHTDGDEGDAPAFLQSQDQLTSFSEGLARLLNGLSLNTILQPDALSLTFAAAENELFSAKYYEDPETPGRLLLETSLLPGKLLSTAVGTETEGYTPITPDLTQLDWEHMLPRVEDVFQRWLAGSEQTTSTGSFRGDAYSGAVTLTRYHLSERDLTLLAQSLISVLPELTDLIDAATLRQWEDPFSHAALENRYRYDLALAYGARKQLVGGSLTVMDGSAQVMTLSAGRLENGGLRVVIGLGLAYAPVYADCIVRAEVKDLAIVGGSAWVELTVNEYTDPNGAGFAAVSQNPQRAEGILSWKAKLQHAEEGVWRVTSEDSLQAGRFALREELEGSLTEAPFSLSAVRRVYGAEAKQPFLTLELNAEEAQPEPVLRTPDAELFELDGQLSQEQQDALLTAVNSGLQNLGIKLFKLVPAELLVFLME